MVCPRCIDTVRDIFNTLKIDVTAIQLGEVIVSSEIEKNRKEVLKERLSEKGFELLEDNKSKLIGKIKSIIVDTIHYSK